MSWTEIIVIGALGALVAGPLVLVRAIVWRRRRRLVALLGREPLTVDPRELDGPVQVAGICRGPASLTAPLSGLPCVGYTVHVSVFCDDTDDGHYWDLGLVDVLAPFELELELGATRVAVEGEPAYLCACGAESARRDLPREQLPLELQNRVLQLARERYAPVDRLDLVPDARREVRVVERLLRADRPVLVLGQGRPASRSSAPTIGPREDLGLVVFDLPRERLLSSLRRRHGVERLVLDDLEQLCSSPACRRR